MDSTNETAHRLAQQLAKNRQRLVLAESCTAGSVAAALATIPGISNSLCGSFVVYRNEAKSQWLNIDRQLLDDPSIGPVSPQVTNLLALAALNATSEADIAAAVTGHIGPGCPAALDGAVFFSLVYRSNDIAIQHFTHLTCPPPRDASDIAARAARLCEATAWVLNEILAAVSN